MGTNKEYCFEDNKFKKNITKALCIIGRVDQLKNKVKLKQPKVNSRSLMLMRKIKKILLQADCDWGVKLTMILLAERLARAGNRDELGLLLKGCRNTFPKRKASNAVDRLIACGNKSEVLGLIRTDETMSNPHK